MRKFWFRYETSIKASHFGRSDRITLTLKDLSAATGLPESRGHASPPDPARRAAEFTIVFSVPCPPWDFPAFHPARVGTT